MRKQLSNSELKLFIKEFEQFRPQIDLKKAQIVLIDNAYMLGNNIIALRTESLFFPSLHAKPELPKVVIDKGAIPFVLKGADIMRPGIIACDEFSKDAVIGIYFEQHCIGVGQALLASTDLLNTRIGKVVKSLHYYNDALYKNEMN